MACTGLVAVGLLSCYFLPSVLPHGRSRGRRREEVGKIPNIMSLNAVVRFEGEGGVKKMDPLKNNLSTSR